MNPEDMTPEEHIQEAGKYFNNLKLIEQAAIKANAGAFKSTVDMHNWLYANGYHTSEDRRIQGLHIAEQQDAAERNKKKVHEINLPLSQGIKAVHVGTDDEAVEHQRVLNARAAFSKEYMKKKGWGENILDLSIEQIMEIRAQEGWKNP